MRFKSVYPVICTDKLRQSADFYLTHFPFKLSFESDWYVSLAANDGSPFELAILDYTHDSIPEGFRRATQGLILNIETENVDAVYANLKKAGLAMHLELRSEDWGQRHFICSDPNGILIDVIQPIPPSGEFAAQFR
jgi:catechol 2,3-dioxygenase-like lactoylglutathione lyase family enzyme